MESRKFGSCQYMVAAIFVISNIVASAGCGNLYNELLNRKILPFPGEGAIDRIIRNNAVGATKSSTLRTLDFTPSSSNALFVAKTGNDIDGNGSIEHPYYTINKAITACDAYRQAVVILDSGTYEEKGFEFKGNFRKLVSALGEAPVIMPLVNGEFMKPGDTVVSEAVFNASSTSQIRTSKFSNDSVVIAYSEGDGRFVVVNKSGEIIVSEKIFEAGSVGHKAISVLSNDNFFISWDNKFVIYNNKGELLKEKTTFTSTGVRNESVALGNDTVVLAVQDSGGILKFKIVDRNGSELISEKTVSEKSTSGINLFSISRFSNDDFVISYFSSNKGYFKIYDKNGNEVVPETEFDSLTSGNGYSTRMDVFSNNFFIIVYTYLNYNASFSIWSKSGDNIVPRHTFMTQAAGTGQYDVDVVSDDIFVITIGRMSDNKSVYYIYDVKGNLVLEPVIFNESLIAGINTEIIQNGNALISYRATNGINGFLTIHNIFHGPSIKVSAESAVNGITFDAGSGHYFDSMFDCTAAFTIQWCDLTGFLINPDTFTGSILLTNSPFTMRNSRIYGASNGLYVSSGQVTVSDSLLFNNTTGYALHINGAAISPGDITIDHCDFFNNKEGGLRLENNGGSEVVKNSIFHDNAGQGINADTAVTVSHSIITEAVKNIVTGELLLGGDPLYVNEGVPGMDDIDLNLQSLIGGFPADSPARALGDDGRNAGAYDVEY